MKRALQDRFQSIGLCSIDDPLFPDPAGGPGGGTPDPDPGANGGDPDPNTGITMQGAAELIVQAQAPLLEKINELGEATAKLAANAANPQNTAPALVPTNDEDFLTQFGVDPEKAVDAKVAAGIQAQLGTIAPLIGNLMNSGTSAFVGLEAQQVDAEFGAGAWAKLFDKPMNTIIDSYRTNNATALADRNTITREVNGLKGQLINELVEFRNSSTKATTDNVAAQRKELADSIVEDVTQRTNMTGGIRRQEGGALEITENVKGYVEERQRAIGGNEDAKTFLERTDYGNSIEEYNAHQEKLKAAAGGTQ
jgi:hypothetical protein